MRLAASRKPSSSAGPPVGRGHDGDATPAVGRAPALGKVLAHRRHRPGLPGPPRADDDDTAVGGDKEHEALLVGGELSVGVGRVEHRILAWGAPRDPAGARGTLRDGGRPKRRQQLEIGIRVVYRGVERGALGVGAGRRDERAAVGAVVALALVVGVEKVNVAHAEGGGNTKGGAASGHGFCEK